MNKHKQAIREEWFNAISHGIMAIAAIGGFGVLIVFGAISDKEWSLFSALFYGLSLITLYVASTLYHAIPKEPFKSFLNVFDHCSIFLLIAGTYTPVLLIVMGGTTGWIFFGIQWGLALVGIVLKLFYTGRYEVASLGLYAIMGWIIIIKISMLYSLLPTAAFWLLVAGGLSYTVGIIFFVLDTRMKYAHFIWHLFVIVGSVLHYLMIVMYVL